MSIFLKEPKNVIGLVVLAIIGLVLLKFVLPLLLRLIALAIVVGIGYYIYQTWQKNNQSN